MAAIKTVVVGAGGRGNAYGQFALEYPEAVRIVGVAGARPHPPRAFRAPAWHRARHDL